MPDQIVGLAPSGSLGSGYVQSSFERGLAANPDFIGQDAGSTDMGPYYHGAAKLFLPEATYRHDLSIMLRAARERRIPLIVGSVLTSGTDAQLDIGVEIIRSIAKEHGLSFRMAVIRAQIDKGFLKKRMAEGSFESVGPDWPLTPELVDRSGPIVAQMGVEPIIGALEAGAEVIIAGRACDDVLFAALPVMRGFDKGLALHYGKILECAGLSAIPYDLGEPLLARIRRDHFEVEPCNPQHRCTTVSVAGHSLYERSDPCLQPGPGGMNDLTDCVFEQAGERTVRVCGSRFVPDPVYRVKLEGAEHVGFRSVVIVGIRDATMIRELDYVIEHARERAEQRFPLHEKAVNIDFRVYGRDAVMRALEPLTTATPHEVGLMIDVVARDQDTANAVAMFVRGVMQHASYPGIITTAGNMAYPFSPFNVPVGPAYRFSAYHLMPLRDPCEVFPMTLHEVG